MVRHSYPFCGLPHCVLFSTNNLVFGFTMISALILDPVLAIYDTRPLISTTGNGNGLTVRPRAVSQLLTQHTPFSGPLCVI